MRVFVRVLYPVADPFKVRAIPVHLEKILLAHILNMTIAGYKFAAKRYKKKLCSRQRDITFGYGNKLM
jgi:hypothetical protein